MLTGPDLLSKVKELGDVSKSDLVRACGYVSGKKDGGDRLNFTAFYEALLEAKGVSLGEGGGKGSGTPGRKLSYVATVQGNGNLLVGKAYTAMLDLQQRFVEGGEVEALAANLLGAHVAATANQFGLGDVAQFFDLGEKFGAGEHDGKEKTTAP